MQMHATTRWEKYSSRDIALVIIFGVLWGLLEITLSGLLKSFRLPISGLILSSLAVMILLGTKFFARSPGTILMMGMIAGFMKLLSMGAIICAPFLAIITEALLAEIIVTLFGINRMTYIISGVLIVGYVTLHPIISNHLIFGRDIYTQYLQIFLSIKKSLQLTTQNLTASIVVYTFVHLLFGFIFGWIAWVTSHTIEKHV